MTEAKLTNKDLEDIRNLYKYAKNKREQIAIICDLYLLKKSTVQRVLGLKVEADKPRGIDARLNAAVRDIVDNGLTYKEAAKKHGVSTATISHRITEVIG